MRRRANTDHAKVLLLILLKVGNKMIIVDLIIPFMF